MITYYTFSEIWRVTDVITTFHFGRFFPFYPPNSPKNESLKKWTKITGDIIILQMCTKNYDQMMCGSWDMMRDGLTDRRTKGPKK